MSLSNTHKYLTELAFAPAPEIKVEVEGVNVDELYQEKSCYDYPWQRYVSTLDQKKSSIPPLTEVELAQKKSFEKQTGALLGALSKWSNSNYSDLDAKRISNSLIQFYNNIFHPSFVDDQTDDFFFLIKKNLEQIWQQLNNPDIELNIRKNTFNELCQNILQCSAGVFYYIQSTADALLNPPSTKNWLRKLRLSTLVKISSQHIVQEKVKSDMDVHVPLAFLKHAEQQLGLNLGSGLERIKDKFAKSPLTHASSNDLKIIESKFEQEYTMQTVVNCLVLNIFLEIKNIIKKKERDNVIALEQDGWFSLDESFIAQVNLLLKEILELDIDANQLLEQQTREMAAGIKRKSSEKFADPTPLKTLRTEHTKSHAPIQEKEQKEKEIKVKSEKITRQETYIRIATDINQRLSALLLEKSHLFKQRPRLINDHIYYLDQYIPAAWFDLVEKETTERKLNGSVVEENIKKEIAQQRKLAEEKKLPFKITDIDAIRQKVTKTHETKSKFFEVLAKTASIAPPAEFKNWQSIAYQDQFPLFIAIIKQLCTTPETAVAFIDYALTIRIPAVSYFMERLLTDDLEKFIEELYKIAKFNVCQLEAPLKNRQEKLMEQLKKTIPYLPCFADNHAHELCRPGGHYLPAALKMYPDSERIAFHQMLFFLAYSSKAHTVPLLNDLMLREPYRSQLLPIPEWERISSPRILISLIENGANLEKLIIKAQKMVVRVVVINAILDSRPKLLKTLLLQGLDWKAEFKYLTNPCIIDSLQHMLKKALTPPTTDFVFAEKLIAAGSELTDRPLLNGTPLILAVFNHRIDLVDALLPAPHTLHYKMSFKGRKLDALTLAAALGNQHIAKKLINAGANINEVFGFEIKQYNALDRANKIQSINILLTLLSIQPEIFDYFFSRNTLEKSHEPLLSRLIEAFINRNHITMVEKILLLNREFVQLLSLRPPYSSILLLAIEEGRIDIAKLLIKFGATINFKNNAGQTPFSAAMKLKQTEVVKDLLLNNLDINAELKSLKKEDGDTVWTNLKIMLQEALTPPPDAVFVKKLMAVGTYLLDFPLPNDEMPFLAALKSGDDELAKLFINRSAIVTINAADPQGVKPLFLAAERGSKNVVEALIKAGANIESTDGVGTSALEVAAWHGHTECVKLLKKAGADAELLISRKGINIETALKAGYSHATLQYMAQIMLNNFDNARAHPELIPVLRACGVSINSIPEHSNETAPSNSFIEELIRLPAAEVVKRLMSCRKLDSLFTPPAICRISHILVMHFPSLNLRVVNHGAGIRYQLTKIRQYMEYKKSKPWMMIAPVIAFSRANDDSLFGRSIPLKLISEHLAGVNVVDIVKFSDTLFFQAHMPAPNPQPNQSLAAPQRKL